MKGIIYKIFRPTEPNTVYIGSSLNSKKQRMNEHRSDYKGYLNGTSPYMSSFEILKYPDAVIRVIAIVEVGFLYLVLIPNVYHVILYKWSCNERYKIRMNLQYMGLLLWKKHRTYQFPMQCPLVDGM